MDRYPYYKYTILLGATRALAHIGIHFTHRVFGLSPSRLVSDITGETSPLLTLTEGSGRCSIGITLPRSSCEAVASFAKHQLGNSLLLVHV